MLSEKICIQIEQKKMKKQTEQNEWAYEWTYTHKRTTTIEIENLFRV